MALERGAFRFGAATFPLDPSTANSLLEDADPALHETLLFLTSVLNTHIGPRLSAQAGLLGLTIPHAVESTFAFDPAPFLLSNRFKFPLLCVYRQKDVWDEQTIAYDKSTSTWLFAYVLPPLTFDQARAVQPVLRAVSVVLRRAVHMGWDPAYRAGDSAWTVAGLQKASMVDASYGAYGPVVDQLDEFYRALTGTFTVLEREQPLLTAFDNFGGADIAIDHNDGDGTSVVDAVLLETHAPPTLVSVTPATGTAAGGTTVFVAGSGFRASARYRALFDGADADAVTVIDASTIRCITPEHTAYPSFLSNCRLIDADGHDVTLEDAFTFTA